MQKKVLTIVLVLCLTLTLLPTVALADGITADISWYDAVGTTFEISSEAQLLGLASLVNNSDIDFSGKTVKLTADITLTTTNWTPIGNGSRSDKEGAGKVFKGIFDGSGKTISDLKINSCSDVEDAIGLFGVVDGGTVQNLVLSNVSIDAKTTAGAGNKNTGAAIGLMVNNAKADTVTVSGTVTGADGVGGIVGRMTISGTINNCTNNTTVTASSGSAGGIVSKAYYTATGKEMNISGCKNFGSINATYAAGGIAAFSAANTSDCTNDEANIAAGNIAGGIVGEQTNYGTISNNKNSGKVTNTTSSVGNAYGGIVGWIRYQDNATAYPLTSTILVSSNTNSGMISAAKAKLGTGGIVGSAYNQATVTKNENQAASITGGTFTAGILGGAQTENSNKKINGETINVYNNVSSTEENCITGTLDSGTVCTDLYVWNNDVGTFKVENNSAAWEAQIGTGNDATKYATLAAAVSAATTGSTITLLRDVMLTDRISVKKTLVLDLNGKMISRSDGTMMLWINGNGDLTIKDSLGGGKVKNTYRGGTEPTADDGRVVDIGLKSAGKVTLESGTLEGAGYGVLLWDQGEFVMNGGTIKSDMTGITGNGNYNNTKITLNGGIIDAKFAGIYHPQAGELNVKDGVSITGGESAVEMRSGTLNITGGSFEATSNTYSCTPDGSGTTTVGAAIAIAQHGTKQNISVNISGGTFTGVKALSESNPQENDPAPQVNIAITNGKFIGDITITDDESTSVTGGTFTTDPSDYAAESYIVKKGDSGYAVVATADGLTSGVYTSDPSEFLGSNYYVSNYDAEKGLWTVSRRSTGGPSVSTEYTVTVVQAEHGDISVSAEQAGKGEPVTITISPDKGYTLETLRVFDKNGREIEVSNKGDGKYTFTMPAGDVTVTASFQDDNTMLNFFVDVTADDYFYDAVLWAVENDITTGMDETHFGPGLSCTRAQIVTFLWRAAGSPETNVLSGFTDVSVDAYYAKAVAWAVENGITDGMGDNLFIPDLTCTRAQAVTFLFRYAGYQGMDTATIQELVAGYGDAAQVPSYALSAFNWALADGIVQGYDNSLMPNDDCTRAQIVTMLYRMLSE